MFKIIIRIKQMAVRVQYVYRGSVFDENQTLDYILVPNTQYLKPYKLSYFGIPHVSLFFIKRGCN